jgi:hypothetical protein
MNMRGASSGLRAAAGPITIAGAATGGAYARFRALLTKYYWLDAADGRVMIGAWAVLIGRSRDCNIVLEAEEISRHHVLIRLGEKGPELLPLGREPVRVNDAECRALTPLHAGDRIEVGEWTFVMGEGETEEAPHADGTAWFLERRTGLLHLIAGPLFRVGGGVADDLIVEGWEPAVLSLEAGGDAPVLTALRPGVHCGRALAEGESVTLANDATITYRAEVLGVRAKRAPAGETRRAKPPRFAVVALLEFLPCGGQLTIEIGRQLHTTELSERRCDLVACLLQPPAPYRPGDFIPDEVLCARVWPGEEGGRRELNNLLYRLRQSLGEEGIDPEPLFERRGGGLRFCLAPRARVIVR